ncbi:hypothetical protein COCNU_scaffold010363G000020 [Cocos nucifera]|nr:hypothetical protein [Cocos nucifera]
MKNKASFMSDQQAQLYTLSLSDFLCFLLLMEARKDKGEPSPASPAAAADSKPPKPAKKRKPNANGPCKTSPAWDHFTMIPDNEVDEPTAACKYCGKRTCKWKWWCSCRWKWSK